ncbi:hypothetical protein ACFFIS_12715 [Virgibacillus soli]|uniref:Transmembrane protein n=1 Tax=Paracerasibacillus soli TaxID=480284 RepID=A0ABU5CNB4_9BACI|nr:hypothetical protein [Virgibacillus soli]MDY0407852.1 hypothetical protein [Virgibacillus soli]
MEQPKYGLALFIFLAIPPVAHLMESIMIIHMHMQMPLIVIAGILMAPFFQKRYPNFFAEWNEDGIPGILLFLIVFGFWMIPKTMDDALTIVPVELFKFFSLAILCGIPLRDSWKKLSDKKKNMVFILFIILFSLMGSLYMFSPNQLCNNYLQIEQVTLAWGFFITAAALLIYVLQLLLINPDDYE